MKLLRLILATALLMTGSVRAVTWTEPVQTVRLDESPSAHARSALVRLAASSAGAIRLADRAGGVIVLRSAGAADLAAWAREHRLSLPNTPSDGAKMLAADDAVVADDQTQRTGGEPTVACCADIAAKPRPDSAQYPHVAQFPSAHEQAAADPSAPRAPPTT